jgi:hypothetical protein
VINFNNSDSDLNLENSEKFDSSIENRVSFCSEVPSYSRNFNEAVKKQSIPRVSSFQLEKDSKLFEQLVADDPIG